MGTSSREPGMHPEARVQLECQHLPKQRAQLKAEMQPEPTIETSDDNKSTRSDEDAGRRNSPASSAVRTGLSVTRQATLIRSRTSEAGELRIHMHWKECKLVTIRLEAEKKRLHVKQAQEKYYKLKTQRMNNVSFKKKNEIQNK
ncbi:hypothetical protein Aduo_001746 [Ancylostoma duodenale]